MPQDEERSLGSRDEIDEALDLWRPGPTKRALVDFLHEVTNGPDKLPAADRIAAFDNDGTLAVEKPRNSVMSFFEGESRITLPPPRRRLPRVVRMVASQPAVEREVDDYTAQAERFVAAYRHPRYQRPWAELVYSPMLQLIDVLVDLEFSVFIVSGTSRDFLRVLAPAYHLNRAGIIGTEAQIIYRDGRLLRARTPPRPDVGGRKPVQLWNRSGGHAVLAVGNTRHDIPLLQTARFSAMVRHDDATREYAYRDRRAERAARRHGWTVISMARDFETVLGASVGETAENDATVERPHL